MALGLAAAPASAGVGPSNNFGSDNTVGDSTFGTYLNDGPIAEWSVWWQYVPGWTTTQKNNYRALADAGFEYYEPLQVTVNPAGDQTDQDVKVVPTTVANPDVPEAIALASCILPGATMYGSHHHRVCDRKQITTYQNFNDITDLGTAVYRVMSHEFGHQFGLRHSDAPCDSPPGLYASVFGAICRGLSATGTPQANTHNAPGTDSLMYSVAGGNATVLNLQDAGNINDHY